jgi:hypothetical protein
MFIAEAETTFFELICILINKRNIVFCTSIYENTRNFVPFVDL